MRVKKSKYDRGIEVYIDRYRNILIDKQRDRETNQKRERDRERSE